MRGAFSEPLNLVDTRFKNPSVKDNVKKANFEQQSGFQRKMYPEFCHKFKLGPDNPELSVEELKFSTLPEY